jgi:hypothetical protein
LQPFQRDSKTEELRWFALADDGDLQPASSDLPSYDANLVALPRERMEEFTAMAARQAC